MKLRVGGKYRDVKGNVVEITGRTRDGNYHGSSDRGHFAYDIDGYWCRSCTETPCDFDLVAEVLTIEPNRYYRTRDGKKAFVAGLNDNPFPGGGPGGSKFKWRGWLDNPDARNWAAAGWDDDGRNKREGTESQYDLVAPWQEPVEIKLSDHGYTAVVTDQITVGCQTLSLAKAEEIVAACKRYRGELPA